MGAHFRATDLYAVGSFDPDHDAVMRIGGETPGGGPILSVGINCQVRIRLPATSDRQFGSRAENPARASNSAEWYARSGRPLQDAGRKTTPSSGSPVVTKRQSAMINLRARATIIVLRVPLRLSAVRARDHNASASDGDDVSDVRRGLHRRTPSRVAKSEAPCAVAGDAIDIRLPCIRVASGPVGRCRARDEGPGADLAGQA